MLRVDVKSELLQWACDRAGYSAEDIAESIPKLPAWLRGDIKPTLKQLEKFARTVHAPIGYLFLPTPPVEKIPIPDFRAVGNVFAERPSPDLLETIYICQQRQEWYHNYMQSLRSDAYPFVASVQLNDCIETVAGSIRHTLGFDVDQRKKMRTWEEALRQFIELVDSLGILVMINGVVGNNNYRKLDPQEFRGFALSDTLAPLVFINGSDTKSAQMFTLAHELAHIWLGETALSDVEPIGSPTNNTEIWCNQVAAELLVPLESLREEYQKKNNLSEEVSRLARCFKVSTLVILRRIHDAGFISQNRLWTVYNEELDRLQSIPKGSGGNFYWTQAARVSKRFAAALVSRTLEGQTLHRNAFQLLGFSKVSTFQELGHQLGVI